MSQVDAVRRFNRFYTRHIGVLDSHYLGSPFPLPQARLLYEIGERGECTASELGAVLDLDLGYLSRLLQALRRQGLVQGEAAKHDGRQRLLTLTSNGRKAFASLDQGSRNAMGEMLAPLRRAERERLVQAMRTLHSVLEPPRKAGAAKDGEVRLRTHRPGDVGWIIERHGAVYQQEYGWGFGFEALVAEIGAHFLKNFDSKRERCWIAELGAEPVGSVALVRQTMKTAKLRLLLVEPKARGRGVGRRLVAECIDFARAAGYGKLVLWTQSNLIAARKLYADLGFRRLKSERHREFGVPLVGEYWELPLGR